MSRLRRLAGGTGVGNDIGLTVVLQGLGAVVAYGTMIAVTRLVDADLFDQYALAQVYVAAGAAIFDFGIVAVTYPRIAVGDPVTSPALLTSYLLRLLIFPVAALIIALFAWASGVVDLLPAILIGLSVALVSAKFTGMRQVSEMVWRVEGKTWIIAVVALADALLFLTMVLIFGQSHDLGPVELFSMLLVANVPGFLAISIPILRRLLPLLKSGLARARPKYARGVLLGALPIAVMGLSAQLFGKIEPLVINGALGLENVGDYTVAVAPLIGTIFIPMTIAVGLLPLIAQVNARKREDIGLDTLYSAGLRLLAAVAVVVGLGVAVYAEQILSLFGPEYVDDAWILQIYSITNLLEYMVIYLDQGFIALGMRKEVMIGTIMALFLALALQVGMVPYLGLLGILIGKVGALLGKLLYQYRYSLPPSRKGIVHGFLRLVPVVASAALLFYLTDSLSPLYRGMIVMPAMLVVLVLTRVVDIAELQHIRKLRIS